MDENEDQLTYAQKIVLSPCQDLAAELAAKHQASPPGVPTDSGILYVDTSGQLKYVSPGGRTTVIALD